MDMVYYPFGRSSYEDSLKVIEADIQHANALAAALPRAKDGARFQMKLVHDQLTPLIMFLLQWIDSSCACLLPRCLNLFHITVYKVYTDGGQRFLDMEGRQLLATFMVTIILPSLRRLHYDLVERDNGPKEPSPELEISGPKKLDKDKKFTNIDLEREDECGICLEPCTKIVLPNCCHAMCINCYRDWNSRAASCPFCRGNIKRVQSRDLWSSLATTKLSTLILFRKRIWFYFRAARRTGSGRAGLLWSFFLHELLERRITTLVIYVLIGHVVIHRFGWMNPSQLIYLLGSSHMEVPEAPHKD
ncbi:putative transcription factor C2H2 family [Helianthus annuus]|nr:putative transcription factor C2H2 family [Helianthus annuus]